MSLSECEHKLIGTRENIETAKKGIRLNDGNLEHHIEALERYCKDVEIIEDDISFYFEKDILKKVEGLRKELCKVVICGKDYTCVNCKAINKYFGEKFVL